MADNYISDVYGYKVFCMKNLYNKKLSTYFGMGRTTPWNSTETVPPIANSDESYLYELKALKQADEVFYAIPDDENGTVENMGQKYRLTNSLSEVLAARSHHMYYKTTLHYDEFPLGTFRQIGLYVGVERTSSDADILYYPADVSSLGDLIVINNRPPIARSSDQKEVIEFIIEI